LKLADYTVTEAGFGADLGAEKFFDIKCRKAGLHPDCVVLVATIRALKYNGGVPKEELGKENLNALKAGAVNLQKHIENIGKYHVPVVVAINRFATDTNDEIEFLRRICEDMGARYALSEVFAKGADGGMELAQMVIEEADSSKAAFAPLYPDEMPLKEKIETISREIYGADGVTYSASAEMSLKAISDLGYGNLPVCMAKTQYSLSDDPKKLGRPSGFLINIRTARVSAGAGFVVCETGKVMTMPGLPRIPSAFNIDVDADGKITGLF
ncbi:MAG: formate--tetrahydrofolate ligase, partial [Butyricicoccus sp.]|nr:formate--tetrahydrofolate ligase [Butyricicoccus sp.]